MPTTQSIPRPDVAFVDRFRGATELLEAVVAVEGLLAAVSPEERRRFIQAAGLDITPILSPGEGW